MKLFNKNFVNILILLLNEGIVMDPIIQRLVNKGAKPAIPGSTQKP